MGWHSCLRVRVDGSEKKWGRELEVEVLGSGSVGGKGFWVEQG